MASMQCFKPEDQTYNHQGGQKHHNTMYGYANDYAMTDSQAQRYPKLNPKTHFADPGQYPNHDMVTAQAQRYPQINPPTHFASKGPYPNHDIVNTQTYFAGTGQYPNHGMAKPQMANCVDYETEIHKQYMDDGVVHTESQYYKKEGILTPQKHYKGNGYAHNAPAGGIGCYKKKEKNMFRKKSGGGYGSGGCSSGSDSD